MVRRAIMLRMVKYSMKRPVEFGMKENIEFECATPRMQCCDVMR